MMQENIEQGIGATIVQEGQGMSGLAGKYYKAAGSDGQAPGSRARES